MCLRWRIHNGFISIVFLCYCQLVALSKCLLTKCLIHGVYYQKNGLQGKHPSIIIHIVSNTLGLLLVKENLDAERDSGQESISFANKFILHYIYNRIGKKQVIYKQFS